MEYSNLEELKALKPGECATYYTGPYNDIVQIGRIDLPVLVRDYDCKRSTVFDFVNGYTEDPSIHSMDELYGSLTNGDLVAAMSASGRDMTADIRLFLASRDYTEHLKAVGAPDFAIESQTEITKKYREHLKNYGDACILIRKDQIDKDDITQYGSITEYMQGLLDRMEAGEKGECYVVRYCMREELDKQLQQGVKELTPTWSSDAYVGVKHVAAFLRASNMHLRPLHVQDEAVPAEEQPEEEPQFDMPCRNEQKRECREDGER